MGSRATHGAGEERLSEPSFSLVVVFDAENPAEAGAAVAGVLRALALARGEGWRLGFVAPDVAQWLPTLEEAVRGEGHGWNEPTADGEAAEFPGDLRGWVRDRVARGRSVVVRARASAVSAEEVKRLRELGRLAVAAGFRWR